jgi:hypothetical protein
MTTWIVDLADGRTCEVVADDVYWGEGALTFVRRLDVPADRAEPVALFAGRTWLMVRQKDGDLLWSNQPPSPPGPEPSGPRILPRYPA